MKGWAAAVALAAVVIATAAGLWVTWDSTQTTATDPLGAAAKSITTTTTDSAADARTPVTQPPPPCTAGSGGVVGDPDADFARLVIDTGHSLPATYSPHDLASVSAAGFAQRDQVRRPVIADLAAMRKAAIAAHAPFTIVSAYRSYAYQADLFQRRSNEVGETEASLRTARPGHSEHQLGTSIDVTDPALADLVPSFATTPAGRWLAAHAHQYGFVMSYPDGAKARTCYDYEPWHLRYVGRDVAAQIHASGVTPREWMAAHPPSPAG